MASFRRLTISNWRQFSLVDLEFHERLTVITGANGSGKSTLLNILSQHLGWSRPFLATPRATGAGTSFEYQPDLFEEIATVQGNGAIGSIEYSNGQSSALLIPRASSVQYSVQIPNQQNVAGVHISPNRPLQGYQRVQEIPTEPMLPKLAFDQWLSIVIQRYGGSFTPQSPLYKMKQALISMAMFGPGNSFSQPIPEIAAVFDGYKEVLKSILPESLGFTGISIRTPDVVITTTTGDWLLDEASGGIISLVEMAWQIFLFSHTMPEFVALIDEPENHLHPAMQKHVMNNLINAFPKVQFVVVTHSPFIVSSVKDSSVYALQYFDKECDTVSPSEPSQSAAGVVSPNVQRHVVSNQLDLVQKAGTSAEVLRDVLGVPLSVPDWVSDDVALIVEEFRQSEFNADTLRV